MKPYAKQLSLPAIFRRNRPAALFGALCAALALLFAASCGEPTGNSSGGGDSAGDGAVSSAASEPADSAAASSDLPANSDSETEEDYPALEIALSYDGEKTVRYFLLGNCEDAVTYSLRLMDDSGKDLTEPLENQTLEAFGTATAEISLQTSSSQCRLVCSYSRNGSTLREISESFTAGEAYATQGIRTFGGTAEDAWHVDGKGRVTLTLQTEETGSAWTLGNEDAGIFYYVLSYADVATLGDKAGAYDRYATVNNPFLYGEETEEGTLLHIQTVLGGVDFLHAGAEYDLRLNVYCVKPGETPNGNTPVCRFLTTRVAFTATDLENLQNSLEFSGNGSVSENAE